MSSQDQAVIALSGGLDSGVLLAHCISRMNKDNIHCYYFSYGSKHGIYENNAAVRVAAHYGVLAKRIDLSNVFALMKSDLLKKGGPIPEGHYEAESMKQTVVPGRNLIFTSVLAGIAQTISTEIGGKANVWLGAHAGDHTIYPDCRPEFMSYLEDVLLSSTEGKVGLRVPFLNMTKSGIVNRGHRLCVPFHHTRTCYKDQEVACGKCGSCQERLEAFAVNGIEDPIKYESRHILPKEAK